MAKIWQYGHPPPKNWHEASQVLKDLHQVHKKKSPLLDRLTEIERMLKDRGTK